MVSARSMHNLLVCNDVFKDFFLNMLRAQPALGGCGNKLLCAQLSVTVGAGFSVVGTHYHCFPIAMSYPIGLKLGVSPGHRHVWAVINMQSHTHRWEQLYTCHSSRDHSCSKTCSYCPPAAPGTWQTLMCTLVWRAQCIRSLGTKMQILLSGFFLQGCWLKWWCHSGAWLIKMYYFN